MDDVKATQPRSAMAPASRQLRQQVSSVLNIHWEKTCRKKTDKPRRENRFLARLTPSSPMERSNYFVEVKRPGEDLFEILYRPTTLSEDNPNPSPQDIVIRRERQTFRRLPRTGAIVFGVKTILTTLDELPMQELQNLAKEIRSWPDYVGEYKGTEVWGAKALEFCEWKSQLQQRKEAESMKDDEEEKLEV